ncbi:MAG: hypothetical protein FJ245_05730 [Nitrospira sp.]|nr:hypothetical protein [Nitrospira sp.]
MQTRYAIVLLLACLVWPARADSAEPPCDKYPPPQQPRCEQAWAQLNQESVAEISQFGLAQLKLRQEGKISPEQHLKENMAFIKQATEKRLKLLSERMAQDKAPVPSQPDRPLQR